MTATTTTRRLALQELNAETFGAYGTFGAAPQDATPDWVVSGDRVNGVVEDTESRGRSVSNLWKLGDLAFDAAPYMGHVRYRFQGFRVAQMERHRGESQVWLGVSGTSTFVVARGDLDSPVPDLDTAAAFLFQPGDLIAIGRGVWHVHFLPLAGSADFRVITARRDPEQDRDLVDLGAVLGTTLEVELSTAF